VPEFAPIRLHFPAWTPTPPPAGPTLGAIAPAAWGYGEWRGWHTTRPARRWYAIAGQANDRRSARYRWPSSAGGYKNGGGDKKSDGPATRRRQPIGAAPSKVKGRAQTAAQAPKLNRGPAAFYRASGPSGYPQNHAKTGNTIGLATL
jgi:hypothetical protein